MSDDELSNFGRNTLLACGMVEPTDAERIAYLKAERDQLRAEVRRLSIITEQEFGRPESYGELLAQAEKLADALRYVNDQDGPESVEKHAHEALKEWNEWKDAK